MRGSVKDAVMLLGLAACSFTDIRTRTIPVLLPCFIAAAIVMIDAWKGSFHIYYCIAAVLATLFFMGIAKLTKEAFGYGDCLLIGVIIECCGPVYGSSVVLTGFFICAAAAGAVMAVKRVPKTYEMPFVPFLCASYTIFFIGEMIL